MFNRQLYIQICSWDLEIGLEIAQKVTKQVTMNIPSAQMIIMNYHFSPTK